MSYERIYFITIYSKTRNSNENLIFPAKKLLCILILVEVNQVVLLKTEVITQS